MIFLNVWCIDILNFLFLLIFQVMKRYFTMKVENKKYMGGKEMAVGEEEAIVKVYIMFVAC